MEGKITEWEFTASVASWINFILADDQTLPFKEAKCEQKNIGSLKRSDLTLIATNGRKAITGEVKLPWASDGQTPFNEEVVQDARKKAASAKVSYFFTWNVNEMVLWEPFKKDVPRPQREYKKWKVATVRNAGDLSSAATEKQLQAWLHDFLKEIAQIYRGEQKIGVRPLDDKFIDQLESFLQRPIQLIFEALEERYKGTFKRDLDAWMRDEQGWIITNDPQGISDNLHRASQYAAYDLMIRLVFYEAMLKRYSGSLDALIIPDHVDTGDRLLTHLAALFKNTVNVTGDYETVFIEHDKMGNRIPFYSDLAVPDWRELVNQIEHYDFSKLKYDVIGRIFERLLQPEERHKYGQYYTRPEVVDLINSFCIRKPDAKVLDPACGGGTFLVRAYYRKKNMNPTRKHGEMLTDLYGVDLDPFAAHLTMINLATRDLIDEENYPQIAREDFFNIRKNEAFLRLPAHTATAKITSKGLGKAQQRQVLITPLDAVVGNPPYVRQEGIRSLKPKNGATPEKGTKEYISALAREEWKGLELSGRSDLHIYFWPHASTFLAENGYFGFLTSSQWMDVEYGFAFQKWILSNFEIIAIFESIDEPWFVGARVATAVTILRQQSDEKKRMSNIVRFVQLRRPIAEILENDGTTPGQMQAVDTLRDEILELESDTVNERYRARLIPQKKLWEDGVKLGIVLGKTEKEDEAQEQNGVAESHQNGDYHGGKWGVYIRAPDLWFDLLRETGKRWAPLGDIAEIRFGVKTGKDEFFYVHDYSREALDEEKFKEEFFYRFRVKRSVVERDKVKIVKAGEGHSEVHAIEAKYLEPEIHSLMEIDEYSVTTMDTSKMILLVNKSKKNLKNTHLLKYIQWGEKKGYHKGATCAGRETKEKHWFDLTENKRAAFILPKIQQYRHITSFNADHLHINSSLLGVWNHTEILNETIGGLLNSTFFAFSKLMYARQQGNEGNIQLDVYSAKMMLVPDPRLSSKNTRNRIAKAFLKMKSRKAIGFISERRLRRMAYTMAGREAELDALPDISELDMPDRRELDDAILEMLGVKTKKRRDELIEALYSHLREFYESVRQKEEKAIENKKRAKRGTPTRPADIAQAVLEEIQEREAYLLKPISNFLPRGKPLDTYDIPLKGEPSPYSTMFNEYQVRFGNGRTSKIIETRNRAQQGLIISAWNHGIRGLVQMPVEEAPCAQFLKEWETFATDRDNRIKEIISERTSDEDDQEKSLEQLLKQISNNP